MSKVFIHATTTLDGFMADPEGGMCWMFGFPTVDEDGALVSAVIARIGAVIGGANKAQTDMATGRATTARHSPSGTPPTRRTRSWLRKAH